MHSSFLLFAYGTFTLYGRSFQNRSAKQKDSNPVQPSPYTSQPRTPEGARFRLFRVRSPLLTESLLMSLPPGTKMFQFPGYASPSYVFRCVIIPPARDWVFPFGDPRIKACLTAPRGLSQPATSFIALRSQGIHHAR